MSTLEYLCNKFGFQIPKRGGHPFQLADFGRGDLASLFKELGFKKGAEIGVESGKYSFELCSRNLNLELSCIDSWASYNGYRDYVLKETIDGHYENAKKLLAPFNVHLIKKFSMDAVKDFKDGELDFVYIDGNHAFEYLTNDIAEWSKKVKVDGIISGHDYQRYSRHNHIHVKDVIDGWTYSHGLIWFLTSPKEGLIGDMVRSWFWVNKPPTYKRWSKQ